MHRFLSLYLRHPRNLRLKLPIGNAVATNVSWLKLLPRWTHERTDVRCHDFGMGEARTPCATVLLRASGGQRTVRPAKRLRSCISGRCSSCHLPGCMVAVCKDRADLKIARDLCGIRENRNTTAWRRPDSDAISPLPVWARIRDILSVSRQYLYTLTLRLFMKTQLCLSVLAPLVVILLTGCAGNDVNYSRVMGIKAHSNLMQATREEKVETVRQLLDQGAQVDCEDPQTRDGSTPLACAAERGYVEIAKLLLAHGADANHGNNQGVTPLMKAARGGSVEIVDEMLKHGADVHRASKLGETALMWAASGPGDNLPLAISSVDSVLACSASGTGDNLPVVIRLVRAGADMNARSKVNVTAMGTAALWGNSSIALWLYDQGADPEIPDKQCEVNGRLAQILGDYFLAQDKVENAHASFEKAQRAYRTTVTGVKAQLGKVELELTLLNIAQLSLAVAAQQQAQIQAHQMAQIAALSHASRSGGGVMAYSAYLQKYNKVYVPTYYVGYIAPPNPAMDVQTYFNEKIKYYEQMEKFIDSVLACFTNYADLGELHGRIENLNGQSRSPYAFAIACVQKAARDYAAKSGNTNVQITPMELPDNLYGKQIESEIRFGASAHWRLTIMSGWTPATQAQEGYDLNRPFLRITFINALNQQTGEVYFRMNRAGDKMAVVYTTNLAEPQPATINGEFGLSDYERRIQDDLDRITSAQLTPLHISHSAE